LIMSQSALSETYKRPDLAMRPAHTFSIVARDPETGELGAAVQSHWFSVGSDVIWAEPGVGAVATQSFIEVSYGPKGLDLMREGKSAEEALATLLAEDAFTNVRQVGMVDAQGGVAVHTGEKAIVHFCNETGDNFTVQANMMHHGTVCTAMKAAFENAKGDLAERMMQALEAAQGEGGDVRGKQSASIIVVGGEKGTPYWEAKRFDLRVEDSPEPLKELRRLIHVSRAYAKMTEGDNYMTEGKVEEALASYIAAEEMLPDNHEAIFWHAATLAAIGRVDESLPLFAKAYQMQPTWKVLVQRLPASDLLPDDPELMAKILAVMGD
ncbi:MAG: DUF1028 domain-containing protein, partial [Alphaproteobacteria bacterium]